MADTPTDRAQLVEVMARTWNPSAWFWLPIYDKPADHRDYMTAKKNRRHARKCAENQLSALEAAGVVCVPRVATAEMRKAESKASWWEDDAYSAMLAASPYRSQS